MEEALHHEWDARSSGKRRRETQRRGDFSPAARAGARCEYILCLPVLPSSVAKASIASRLPPQQQRSRQPGGGSQELSRSANLQGPFLTTAESPFFPNTSDSSASHTRLSSVLRWFAGLLQGERQKFRPQASSQIIVLLLLLPSLSSLLL